ncbi:SoxR reducing system RseC family protein [bacterium]|nr:SoxR reducing system RseC family protein [bacterium]
MKDLGRIVALQDELAQVAVVPQEGCAACALKDSCTPTSGSHHLWALNRKNGNIGDEVVVELQPSVKIMGSALVFIFPLIGLFLGCIIGYFLGKSQDHAVAGGVIMLIASFFIMRKIDSVLARKKNLKPVITQVLD